MLRLLSDENVHDGILQGLLQLDPALDMVRAVDVGLGNTDDLVILDWALRERRVIITGDLNTMVGFAYGRIAVGEHIQGVLALKENAPFGRVIDDIHLAAHVYEEDELRDRVEYVPL